MMKKLQSKETRLVLSLAIVCMIAMAGAWVGLQKFDHHLVKLDAAGQAVYWQRHLGQRLENVETVLKGELLSRRDKLLFDSTVAVSGAYRYRILNAQGIIVRASQPGDVGKAPSNLLLERAARTGLPASQVTLRPVAEVERHGRATGQVTGPAGGDRSAPRVVTRTLIPFIKNRRLLGAIEVFVDSTRKVAAHDGVADYLKIGLAALFLLLFLVCGAFLSGETRKRERNDNALKDANRDARKAQAQARDLAAQLELKVKELAQVRQQYEIEAKQRTDTQTELANHKRLAAMGQLTSTVAHELRNPLGAVRTAAYLIEKKTQDKGLGLEKSLKRVENGIRRCDNIITELLDFTRTRDLAVEEVELEPWVRSVVADQEVKSPIEVAFDFQASGAVVSLDASRFRRVLTNLLKNAAEAMIDDSGGVSPAFANPKITVRTRIIGERLEVSFIDNGPGISPDDLQKVAEPLFSTKPTGVGLGVPAAQQIMEQHGGGFEIFSEQGNGAIATVWLPLSRVSQKAA